MRGEDRGNNELFSYVSIEDRVHARHPLRLIREVVNDALASMSADFDRLYAAEGRPRSACCGRCCCRRSIRSVRNGC